jgi:hypothetical protein
MIAARVSEKYLKSRFCFSTCIPRILHTQKMIKAPLNYLVRFHFLLIKEIQAPDTGESILTTNCLKKELHTQIPNVEIYLGKHLLLDALCDFYFYKRGYISAQTWNGSVFRF